MEFSSQLPNVLLPLSNNCVQTNFVPFNKKKNVICKVKVTTSNNNNQYYKCQVVRLSNQLCLIYLKLYASLQNSSNQYHKYLEYKKILNVKIANYFKYGLLIDKLVPINNHKSIIAKLDFRYQKITDRQNLYHPKTTHTTY